MGVRGAPHVIEKYGEYGEYNDFCRWDSRRFCTLSDGSGGKCVMNGLCAPPSIFYEGPDVRASGYLNPNLRPHSPIAPTWRWNQPSLNTLESIDEIEADKSLNEFSNKFVMKYANAVQLPPDGPLPRDLPIALAALSSAESPALSSKRETYGRRRTRRRARQCPFVAIFLLLIVIVVACSILRSQKREPASQRKI